MHIRPILPHEVEQARQLLACSGWSRKVEDTAKFQKLIEHSQIALVAIEDGQVVGFMRALSDGIFNGYISMLVVAREFQGRGIGSALMRQAMGMNLEITWVLRADRDGVAGFYERLGFNDSTVAMERLRS
jgi:ribosomal protein S18 acetylase RimI-like enzyme